MPKGIYIRTDYHKKINSDSHKGIKMPEIHKKKVSDNSKKLWKTKRYQKLISNNVSKGVKHLWKNKKYQEAQNKVKYHKHHLYLKENSDKQILMPKKIHQKFHLFAYHYLVKTKQIDSYLKWFKKNIGGF
jgi:hypothetical protein